VIVRQSILRSPVWLAEIAKNGHDSRFPLELNAEILCSADCVESKTFEPSIQVLLLQVAGVCVGYTERARQKILPDCALAVQSVLIGATLIGVERRSMGDRVAESGHTRRLREFRKMAWQRLRA
jgi:hypothetical protein